MWLTANRAPAITPCVHEIQRSVAVHVQRDRIETEDVHDLVVDARRGCDPHDAGRWSRDLRSEGFGVEGSLRKVEGEELAPGVADGIVEGIVAHDTARSQRGSVTGVLQATSRHGCTADVDRASDEHQQGHQAKRRDDQDISRGVEAQSAQ